MKRILVLIAALVAALGSTSAALASDTHPITEKALGAASIAQPYTIHVRNPADVLSRAMKATRKPSCWSPISVCHTG